MRRVCHRAAEGSSPHRPEARADAILLASFRYGIAQRDLVPRPNARVLLTTFSRPLATSLERKLKNLARPAVGGRAARNRGALPGYR